MITDVLIIGAGPTGLMLANQLNRFGIDFIIIDHKTSPSIESRAMSVSSRSMEVYQQLELSDKIISQSKIVKGVKMFNNGKIIVTLNSLPIVSKFKSAIIFPLLNIFTPFTILDCEIILSESSNC